MEIREQLGNRERRRRERRVWARAFIASVGAHALIFLLWGVAPVRPSPFSAAGPRAGDARAAAGGMQTMNVRTPPSTPVIPPPVPLAVEVEVEPVEFEDEPAFDPAALEGAATALQGPGLEDGTGQGDGGTAEEGLFRVTPPSPRGMILPPENDALKGMEVQIWVFVDARGRVVADSTFLRPPTRDGQYNRRLIEEAAQWIFTPAMKGGEPVATWYHYAFSM